MADTVRWGAETPVRSALFVPANRRAWIERVAEYGADAVVLDLEDATPPDEKASARDVLTDMLPLLREQGQQVWVRVNGLDTDQVLADLDVACRDGVSVICLPKARAADLIEADRLVSHAEGRNGVELGTIGLYPILESAAALLDASTIFASTPRVRYGGALATPGADIEFELGFRWSSTFEETLAYRSLVLLAARANGITNPVTGLVAALDADVTRRFGEQSRSIGYAGMFVIHPSQVPIANETFSPSRGEVAWSEEITDTYARALSEGRGTMLDSGGRMVDHAMVRTAERIAERHRYFGEREDARPRA